MESVPEEKKGAKRYVKPIVIMGVVFILIIGGYLLLKIPSKTYNITLVCGDGTPFKECSSAKPYFCDLGVLVENSSKCGCPDILTQEGDYCVSQYQTEPKTISLKYILNGGEGNIDLTVYKGLTDYISELPIEIRYSGNETPSLVDFKLRNMNEPEQRELLMPLVKGIQNMAKEKEEQARIAISLVQNLPYGGSGRTVTLVRQEVNYSRYPYETLYDNKGLCGEKSEILAFLLRELGYGVAFIHHSAENHDAVGIKCPIENSLDGSGYCFIETTGPSIISDHGIEYVGGIKLFSLPQITPISEGVSLPRNMEEYEDARTLNEMRGGSTIFSQEGKFLELKEKYGLIEEYNIK